MAPDPSRHKYQDMTVCEVEVFHRDLLRIKRHRTMNVPVVICGNKCDLEDKRIVSKTEGEELADRLKAKLFETSALANLHMKMHSELLFVKSESHQEDKSDAFSFEINGNRAILDFRTTNQGRFTAFNLNEAFN